MADYTTCSVLGSYGRLGNQCFQLACVIGYAEKHKKQAVFRNWYCSSDNKLFGNYFHNQLEFNNAPRIDQTYTEPHYHYQEIPYYAGSVNLHGYFQSEKYFEHCPDLIRHYLTPQHGFERQIRARWADVLRLKTCSIHIRRTDYLNTPELYPVQDMNYYQAAIEYMVRFYGVERFIVFGDDLDWGRANFRGGQFIFAEGQTSIYDLFLQSFCQHNIIANSSFSWWASYLNNNPDKVVIAPDRWLLNMDDRDVYREEMIRL